LEALPEGPETPPGDRFYAWATAMQRLGAALALDAGDLSLACAWLAAHDRWMEWGGAVLGRVEGQLGWATYHRLAGDLRAARERAETALAQATEPRQPLALLAAHRLLGELAIQEGRQGEAEHHLAVALALAAACGAPYERALTLLARAELYAATGRAGEAKALLDEVRALCAPLRAAPALARAAELARRLGTPPPARPAGLSPREVDVLHLLASGKSNKAIAAALGMSVRTLERHITNLYTKIDVVGRAEAIAFVHRHGLR
jgi:DNA-binding CsgD family transcriptional regulator